MRSLRSPSTAYVLTLAVDYVQADGETGPTAVKVWRKTFPEPQAT